ncbi:MAG: hypothetical protein LC118_07655 [Dehalococcoidia bacterium]|nr:hypothetical protein [Dehalococcoidia bacterium]
MAEKQFEADDPYEFVAVRIPYPPGVDPDEVMARTFIEEYALMGMPRERVLMLFRSKYFAGTHAILQNRGEAFVEAILDDVYGSARSEVA